MKLIKFTQPTCQPCKVLDMMLGQMNAEVDEVRLLATEEELEKAKEEFGIMGTPTLVLFDDEEKEIARVTGVMPPKVAGILTQAGKL